MTVKQTLLRVLEENKGSYISGEQLASQLGVSRNAVWKAVQQLLSDGYEIDSVRNRGYRLAQTADILSVEGISAYASPAALYVYQEIDSTNEEAKRLSAAGTPHGTLVAANAQTAGKGRRGRSFYSPSDTGVYFSIVFRPRLDISDSILITTAASVAVCRAIADVCGAECEIKWVNDIYLNEKKICGILTEAVADMESGQIGSIIVGIGINVLTEEFPAEVGDRAASIYNGCSVQGIRSRLVAAVYRELMKIADALPDRSFLAEYRQRSNVIGKMIRYTQHGVWKEALAVGIDDDGGLVIESQTEGRLHLHTGEITVRVEES